jgi:hypothetical protein
MCRISSLVRNNVPIRRDGNGTREESAHGPRRPSKKVIKKQKGNRLHRRDPQRWAELKEGQIL